MYNSCRLSASHHGRLSSSMRGSGLAYFFLSDFSSAIVEFLFCRSLLVAQDERRARVADAERATGAVAERQFAILDLARAAFAAQLPDRLDDQKDAAHPRMVRREPAAVGVGRERAVVAEPPPRNERAALA